MTRMRCIACDRPIVLVNIDKANGRLGLRYGWVHYSWWANRTHIAIPPKQS